jgi:hypothetical protein
MTFRFKPKKIGCFQLFVSSLATLIFIHYLAVGFIDVVLSVNDLLEWLQKSGFMHFINSLFGGR